MALIEREAAKAKKVYCEERHEYVVPVAELDWLPTIDAAPVVHGRWICDNSGSLYKYHCSVCKKERHSRFDRYCSNCGCKMKENKQCLDL